ncbi:dienelactone hydrolase family protein [Roseobacter sp. HKCCA0434]|uniref:dienelactone hydrolase family protein n=1 Tax=Roseobacter sp. HKCCA0434 TaxID=3079297 RepID=UPI002905D7AB|nr:dienelactone hydrolase family protein [Roseobacter sp. HKCCA0434]
MPDGWSKAPFTAPVAGRDLTRQVHTLGEGPDMVLIQELPGVTPELLALAGRLAAAGFRVHVPHLFGPWGRSAMLSNTLRVLCLRREFAVFARDRSSPVVDWLRALCAQLGGPVGVIGMCLTGNFALTLIAEDSVAAAVASQPSLPIARQDALHMSAGDIAASRAALDVKPPMRALRFEGDPLCRAAKFAAIDAAFNDDRTRVETTTLPGRGHAVLTAHFVDEAGHPTRAALDTVLAYLDATLRPERA